MEKVRIGFVGVGAMGQMAHLRNYVTLEDCEVVAIAELRPKTRELVARRYGVAKTYADHREMLATEELDGVVASQPFARSYRMAALWISRTLTTAAAGSRSQSSSAAVI